MARSYYYSGFMPNSRPETTRHSKAGSATDVYNCLQCTIGYSNTPSVALRLLPCKWDLCAA
jgi:hypothetical protein